MTIILNKDGTIHHIETDRPDIICPCYSVDREFTPESIKSPDVYQVSYKNMNLKQSMILSLINSRAIKQPPKEHE